MTDPIEAAARMPIMLPNARADDVRPTLPMSLLNEEWAQRNHSQSLTRLAQRGGLSPCEAAAIMQRRPWHRMDIGKSLAVVFSAERDSEIEALRAKLADCQAVIRHKGHDADCWAERCVICGNPPSSITNHYFGSLPSHNFQPGPCSDACGHDRVVGHD